MTRVVFCVFAAFGVAVFCDGCRHIKAPYTPKEPAQPKKENIEDPAAKPAATKPASVPTYKTYVIRPGDTLGKIARKVNGNGANTQQILDANPGLEEKNLTVGQTIRVPVKFQSTPSFGGRQVGKPAPATLPSETARRH